MSRATQESATLRAASCKGWLDNQQVCQLLNISKRTLQTLRGNGSLSYTQINHKIYYRSEDVRSFLAVLEARRKHEQRRRNGV